tara:strand:+ start:300 stop:542 length:243 start_codon:yes stop_codon:yes gene_type:complete
MEIYIGNLAYDIDGSQLEEVFSEYGEVTESKLIINHDTGRSKGFGFITMTNDSEANTAIETLDGAEINGRPVKVNEARAK